MRRAGSIVLGPAEFSTALQKKLLVKTKGYFDQENVFPVFKELPNGSVLVPRYILGTEAFVTAEATLSLRVIANYPTFEGELWEEQKPGVGLATAAIQNAGGVFLNAKPGSGKTVAALFIVSQLKPAKTIILVDQDNLADQWTERIRKFMPKATVSYGMPLDSQRVLHRKHGQTHMLEGLQHFDTRGHFMIIMAQSLARHPQNLRADLLIVDEAHVFSAPTFSQAIFNIDYYWSMALSANETRPDGLEWIFRVILGEHIVRMEGRRMPAKAIFYPASTEGLTWDEPYPGTHHDWFKRAWCKWHRKMTCRWDCQFCETSKKAGTSDLTELSRYCAALWRNDEWEENSLERHLAQSPRYNAWLLDNIGTFVEAGRDIFVFARLREPLARLKAQIDVMYGNVSELYLGHATTPQERKRNERALSKQVTLCTYQKAGKGLDVQRKDGILFASPVSKNRLNQVIGRTERALIGKKQPVVVHAVIPFVTAVARMKGCIRWYMEHGYDVQIHESIARYAGVKGRAGGPQRQDGGSHRPE